MQYQAPEPFRRHKGYTHIFLAGSIEMGKAEDWQDETRAKLESRECIVYNPRRNDWDSSWSQDLADAKFVEQVRWELDALAAADYILMYFDPKTKSPISLLELGLYAASGKLRVVCPEGFWRKGNVDIVCMRHGVRQFNTIDEALESF